MKKYIDSEKLISEIEEFSSGEYGDNTFGDDVANGALSYVLENIIPSLRKDDSGIDIEKFNEKIRVYQERYDYPESVTVKGAMAFMARMFYMYPDLARQWYDSLPKATMD